MINIKLHLRFALFSLFSVILLIIADIHKINHAVESLLHLAGIKFLFKYNYFPVPLSPIETKL